MLKKYFFCLLTLCLMWPAVHSWGAPQAPAQAPAGPVPKDAEEANLINSTNAETDPAKKITLLDQWKQKYPDTAYKTQRLQMYVQAYQGANQAAKAFDAAKQLLAVSPDDVTAHLSITSLAPFVGSSDPAFLADSEKSARALPNAPKPAGVTDAQWAPVKAMAPFLSHKTLGWVAMSKKPPQNDAAEKEFTEALQLNAADAQISFWLGGVVLAEKNPDKNALALFSFARAAAYDGPGALAPAGRQQVDAYLTKVYNGYHGADPQGLAELKTMAKAAALPPADLKIKSSDEIQADKDEALRKNNPLLAMFLTIKDNLTGADSATFWGQMKGTSMPQLHGVVISAKPAVKPKVVELAMSQGQTAEITLTNPETAARCQLDPGTQVDFEGSEATNFTATPFMISLEGGKITTGCTMAPPPAKAAPKAGAATKKAPAKAAPAK